MACRNREVKEYLRFYSPPCTFSNALSPMQAATVLTAFEIIESDEGAVLRDKLMANIVHLRGQLVAAGFEVYGDPSAIVCVKIMRGCWQISKASDARRKNGASRSNA